MMMGFGFLGLLFAFGVLLVFLGGGTALIFRQAGSAGVTKRQEYATARQILDGRLASGEISQEEYDSIRARVEYAKVKEEGIENEW